MADITSPFETRYGGHFRLRSYQANDDTSILDVVSTTDKSEYIIRSNAKTSNIEVSILYGGSTPQAVQDELTALFPTITADIQAKLLAFLKTLQNSVRQLQQVSILRYGPPLHHVSTTFSFRDKSNPEFIMTEESPPEGKAFAPKRLHFFFPDNISIALETPAAEQWMKSVTSYLKLSDALAANRRHDADHTVFLSHDLFDLLPEAPSEPPVRYADEIKLLLEGVLDKAEPTINTTNLLYFRAKPDATEPLPYFRTISIPSSCSAKLKKIIDIDGDGFISNIDEAWRTHEVAKNMADYSAVDQKTLHYLNRQLTQVNMKQKAIRVFGHVIQPLSHNQACDDEQRLFVLGEALRSFGPVAMQKWTKGTLEEKPLRFVMTTKQNYRLNPVGLNFLEATTFRLFVDGNMGNALYSRRYNLLVTGCTTTLSDQYALVRHECGHVVDDFMHDSDVEHGLLPFGFSFETPKSENDLIADSWVYFLSTQGMMPHEVTDNPYKLTLAMGQEEGKHGLDECFVPHHADRSEWFAYLFELPQRWQFSNDILKDTVARFLQR
ncbi:MAG: hypothetical protein HY540_00460 [Deltaproteobacteria bacterium]|nr:hypothetical protein [Deltaproteobacteria bacterium]